MIVKNLMEEKVITLAKSYFESKRMQTNTKLFADIVGYVLNRVPPQYVSSSRGFLHNASKEDIDQLSIDIQTIIDEGYDIIQRRDSDKLNDKVFEIKKSGYYVVYPIVIGNIFYADNFSRIESGTITLYRENEPMKSYDSNFPNPFILSAHSPGRFMFCLEPELVDNDKTFISYITLVSDIPSYGITKTNIILEMKGRYYQEYTMPLFDYREIDNIYIVKDDIK